MWIPLRKYLHNVNSSFWRKKNVYFKIHFKGFEQIPTQHSNPPAKKNGHWNAKWRPEANLSEADLRDRPLNSFLFLFFCGAITSLVPLLINPTMSCRKQRSPPMTRCGSSWTAGGNPWWSRMWRRASSASSPRTTPSSWSPPPSSLSPSATATWRRSEAS